MRRVRSARPLRAWSGARRRVSGSLRPATRPGGLVRSPSAAIAGQSTGDARNPAGVVQPVQAWGQDSCARSPARVAARHRSPWHPSVPSSTAPPREHAVCVHQAARSHPATWRARNRSPGARPCRAARQSPALRPRANALLTAASRYTRRSQPVRWKDGHAQHVRRKLTTLTYATTRPRHGLEGSRDADNPCRGPGAPNGPPPRPEPRPRGTVRGEARTGGATGRQAGQAHRARPPRVRGTAGEKHGAGPVERQSLPVALP